MEPSYTYRARLVRVIDGDTLVADFDLGFRLTATLPVRLLGINAPEMSEAAGKVSRAWAIAWFERLGPDMMITTAKDPEKYGRWLGTIHSPSQEMSLNDALVAAGMARPYLR
jgi:endonuclease YncB( thermonuclease family)